MINGGVLEGYQQNSKWAIYHMSGDYWRAVGSSSTTGSGER